MNNIKFINRIYDFLSDLQNALDSNKISKPQIKLLIKRFILNYLKKTIEIEKMLNEVLIPEWSLTDPNLSHSPL